MLPRDGRAPAKRRADYRPPAFLVPTIALEFDLDPEATRVTTTLAFRRNPAASATEVRSPLVLDGEHQSNVEVELDGVALAAPRITLADDRLTLNDPPREGTLTIRSTHAPARNLELEGLYISSGVFCTQCEPEGFRRITYFPDRPDVLATYTVTLRAGRARYPVLLSNGNLVEQGALDDGRHFAKWHDPFPKPSYLFALVAGDLAELTDTFTTASGRNVRLSIHSTPDNLPRCTHAMDSLKRAMRWDEERFGREYDLDRFMIFCADDFNMGAMENKGLNIFNSRLVLADPASATDDDFAAIEGVIGHEYFHNWTGNRVTCRDWFQLSLKEGLTVYRDQEFSGDQGSHAVERISAVDALRRLQYPEDAGPGAHPIRPDEYQEINNFYTATVYEKGAEVIRMQHALLGRRRIPPRHGPVLRPPRRAGGHLRGLRAVDERRDRRRPRPVPPLVRTGRHAGRRCARRIRCAARAPMCSRSRNTPIPRRASRRSCRSTFRSPWDWSAPTAATCHCSSTASAPRPARRACSTCASRCSASRSSTSPPSRYRRSRAATRRRCGWSSVTPTTSWRCSPRTTATRSTAGTRHSVCFANAILALAADHREGRTLALPQSIGAVVGHLLADTSSDPALLALALRPPDTAYVAALEDQIDVDGVTAARTFIIRALATGHRAALEALVERHRPAGSYAPAQSQVGPRKLRNVALHYLGALDDPRARARVVAQYDDADNMTDAIAALAALADSTSIDRDDLFARFEAKWRHDPLVLDKWFTQEAMSDRADTLARVRSLISHPGFNARNPNRVRALVGAFATRNLARFHAADGEGYAFIADQVLSIDATNPKVAARIAGSFDMWKRFPQPRRGMMQAALQRLAAAPELSGDVSEIVTRSLAG